MSALGARISSTALPLLVLATTHSPADAGAVGAADSAPFLLSLLAGPVVDRANRKWIMFVSELVACTALLGIPVAAWSGALTVTQLAVTAFVQGCCTVLFGLAETAALPRIVPPAQLGLALAQNEGKSRGVSLLGPPLGGLLFGLGRAVPFLADALSYALSAASLLLIRTELQGERDTARKPLLRETADRLSWLWRQPFVRAAVLLIAAGNLVFQALVLVLTVLVQRDGGDSGSIGLMLGIYGGGGFLGSPAAGWLQRRLSAKAVVIGANWVWAALFPLLLLADDPVVLGVIAGAGAFVGPLWNVVMMSYRLTLVPEELMGRVGSAVMTVVWGTLPLGSLLAGCLLTSFGPTTTLLVLTAFMLATAVAGTVTPAVRNAPVLHGR